MPGPPVILNFVIEAIAGLEQELAAMLSKVVGRRCSRQAVLAIAEYFAREARHI